jgi:3-hydroxyisobutyrate dehydrogenase-like beta-hydroxyacid dehydrogenase
MSDVSRQSSEMVQKDGTKTGKTMHVGFIGLGRMGAGMAGNLLKAGHQVTVYNRTRVKGEALIAQGAKAAISVSEACQGDAVITMLANTRRSKAWCFAPTASLPIYRLERCMFLRAQ